MSPILCHVGSIKFSNNLFLETLHEVGGVKIELTVRVCINERFARVAIEVIRTTILLIYVAPLACYSYNLTVGGAVIN